MSDSKDNTSGAFRGKKEPIIEYDNKVVNNIGIISSLQERIVFSDKRINTIYGCAGSRKTDTLCKYGLQQFRSGKNVLFLTLVSSVTDEIRNRVSLSFEVNLTRAGNHFFGPVSKSKPTVEISTFDAFIYKQLDSMQESGVSQIYDDVISVDEQTYKQRMYRLLNSSHDKFVMKNDKLADVILIDEFQDLEMDKIKIIINILKYNPHVKCMVIGDYLQTIFERSIVVDDQVVEHPFELWKKSFIAEESYEEFEINVCYRCPEAHIKFINHIIGDTEPRKKYGISNMSHYEKPTAVLKRKSKENKDSPKNGKIAIPTVHKPFIFIHEDIGSGGSENVNGSYIADQAFRIINTIIESDKEESLSYRDVTLLMLKSNGQPVFRQLQDLMNAGTSQIFHIHETKGDGYHDRIDWSKSEGKATGLSVHGYKGRGNKIILFLGLNSFNMPRKDNVGTAKELIDYSLLNVGMSRSIKYLIIGVTSSSPTTYFYNRRETFEDFAYCSWRDDQEMPHVYKCIKESLCGSKWNRGEGSNLRCPKDRIVKAGKKHWHGEVCKIRRDALWFEKYFYEQHDCYPKHRIALVTDAVCDSVDDPEEILPGVTKGTRTQFGRAHFSGEMKGADDYEKRILGVVAEWVVNRNLYLNSEDIDFLKYMTFMFEDGSDKLVYFTNNETLLNLVADKEINSFAIHHIYDQEDRKSANVTQIWKRMFDAIKIEHESLLNRDKSGLISKIESLSEGLPRMIVHSNFKDEKFMQQLRDLCSREPNEKIQSSAFWNFGLFQMLLSEKIRIPYLSTYYGRMNYNLEVLLVNAGEFCQKFLVGGKDPPAIAHASLMRTNKLNKQLSHSIDLVIAEDLILGSRTQNRKNQKSISAKDIYADDSGVELKKMSKPFIISGRSDLYDHESRKVIEIKASGFTEMNNAWITQALTYCCLPLNSTLNGKEIMYEPRRFCIVNLLKGCIYELELPADFNRKKCMEKIMKKLKWPQDVVIEYFTKYQ